jgi:hypothetical protein
VSRRFLAQADFSQIATARKTARQAGGAGISWGRTGHDRENKALTGGAAAPPVAVSFITTARENRPDAGASGRCVCAHHLAKRKEYTLLSAAT